MTAANRSFILTINGGSSSIKFAAFTMGLPGESSAEVPLARVLDGIVERIGLEGTSLTATDHESGQTDREKVVATNHHDAALQLAHWLGNRFGNQTMVGVGHRIVHGGPTLLQHARVTDELVEQLRHATPLDLAHLPREITLLEVFRRQLPDAIQVACFDTAFHRDLPRVAQLLPIPRKYFEQGYRRLGFHGLSYTYLMGKLRSIAPQEAAGRVVIAHLGSGASMAALAAGRPIDTTMGFTPTAGLVMGTRPGDFDPGLLIYLIRQDGLSPKDAEELVTHGSGLLGLSETSFDMRDLVERRASDPRADDAVSLFCYQAKKYLGAYAAALGGLDTLLFSGGIGEHSPEVRAEICQGLAFLGIELEDESNRRNQPVISARDAGVTVRVIPTDEERVMAEVLSGFMAGNEHHPSAVG